MEEESTIIELMEIKERIASMTNSELADQLLIIFKKTFKKLFENKDEKDPVYRIMNYVMELNKDNITEDYSEFEHDILNLSWSRSRDAQPNFNFSETVNIRDKKNLSILLLYKLVNSISKKIDSLSETELEFLTHIKIIYELYLSDSGLSQNDVIALAKSNQSYELYVIADELLR